MKGPAHFGSHMSHACTTAHAHTVAHILLAQLQGPGLGLGLGTSLFPVGATEIKCL